MGQEINCQVLWPLSPRGGGKALMARPLREELFLEGYFLNGRAIEGKNNFFYKCVAIVKKYIFFKMKYRNNNIQVYEYILNFVVGQQFSVFNWFLKYM